MNSVFTRYEIATGKGIDQLLLPDNPAWINLYYDNGMAVYRGTFDPKTHYMSGGSPVERPAPGVECSLADILADGEDTAELSGLPVPCVARISGPTGFSELSVPHGVLLFSASVPGAYRVQIEAFPFLDWEVTINAV